MWVRVSVVTVGVGAGVGVGEVQGVSQFPLQLERESREFLRADDERLWDDESPSKLYQTRFSSEKIA